MLIEMAKVFKGLYVDKNQKDALNENQKIDITICICILMAKSQTAKITAIEQNLAKKVLEIC